MEKDFQNLARAMAQKENSIVFSKLLAFCDRCGELKRFAELNLITGPITTEPCPRGLRTGAYTVLFKQDAPRLVCRSGCTSDLIDSLILTVKKDPLDLNLVAVDEPKKTQGPGPSTSELLYMDIKNFLSKLEESYMTLNVPMGEFTQLAQFLESQGWKRGG